MTIPIAQTFLIWVTGTFVGLAGGMLATGHDPIVWSVIAGFYVASLIVNAIGLARS